MRSALPIVAGPIASTFLRLLPVLCLLVGLPASEAGQPASGAYTLTEASLNSGGGVASAGSYSVISALGGLGDTASILALAASSPSVAVSNPVAGAPLGGPLDLRFDAVASDPGGAITHVDFYTNNVLLKRVSSPPYGFIWSNVVAGAYTLVAKVQDDSGVAVSSSPINLVVTNALRVLSGTIRYYGSGPLVPGVVVSLSGDDSQTTTTAADGTYQFTAKAVGNYTVSPALDTDTPPNRGVTTLDVHLIRLHILSVSPLDSPFKLLAADANQSRSITSLDTALLRRLVLGASDTLPAGLWKFVASDFQFADPLQPWSFAGSRQFTGNLTNDSSGLDFVAVKVGDVNDDWTSPAKALTGLVAKGAKDHSRRTQQLPPPSVTFQTGGQSASPGGLVAVALSVTGFRQVTSAQFSLAWDPAVLQFTSVGGFNLAGLGGSNFGITRVANGKLAFSWDDPAGLGSTVADGTVIFTVQFSAVGASGSRSIVSIGDDPTPREVSVNSVLARLVSLNGTIQVQAPTSPATLVLSPRRAGGLGAPNTFSVTLPTVAAKTYFLEATDSLLQPNWRVLGQVVGDGTVQALFDLQATSAQRFYRVRVE